jgi:hypothetical protein
VDFYSPDTFNFTVLDVSADGRTLAVTSVGMDSTAQNAGLEYVSGPQARTLFSFQVDALPVVRSGFVFDRRTNKMVQQLTLTNNTGIDLSSPIDIVLTDLSANTSLANATGTTSSNSPYITIPIATLASGASASVALQFVRPGTGAITYGTQVVTGTANP